MKRTLLPLALLAAVASQVGSPQAGADDKSAIRQAWTAVKNGWRKDGNKWVRKSQPGVADVHVTTALGNDKKRKAKDFISAIAEAKGRVVDENGVQKKNGVVAVERSTAFRVTKVDDEQMAVFGWASVTHSGHPCRRAMIRIAASE